jgi:hypothetical protein
MLILEEDPIVVENLLRVSGGVLLGLLRLRFPQFVLVCEAAFYVKLQECFFDVGPCVALVAR